MKSISQVTRKALLQSSIMVLGLVVLFTNAGFTWLFGQYVTQIRANEVALVIETATETLADGQLTAEEKTRLRQTANQSSVHLHIENEAGIEWFDSLIGGNGAKRQLLSREKAVLSVEKLKYTAWPVKIPGGDALVVRVGQQSGWALNQEDKGFVAGVNLAFLVVALLILPLVWVMSKWFAVKLSKPIIDIQRATERIKDGEYRDVALESCETLELQSLSESVEQLAFQLENQEALRRRLTTDMAHELRSPLAVLRSQIEGVQDGVLTLDAERLARLGMEVHRLTQLIDDMNELTNVENDLYTLDWQQVDLTAMAGSLAEDYKVIFEQKGLVLTAAIDSGIWAKADPFRMKQVWVNFITNALKYTDAGSVTIKLIANETHIIFEVADTGIGIDQADLPFVFQRFYRADPSRSRQTGGAGIGLTIAERLVKMHGGQLEINSILGEGTVVRMRLPKNMSPS